MAASSGRQRRDWASVVADHAASGLTAQAYCAARRINRSLFYHWRCRLREEAAPSAAPAGFVQLQVGAGHPDGAGVSLVSPGGWRIEVTPDFDVATLQRVCACVPSVVGCSR
jgi:hypothetical protein